MIIGTLPPGTRGFDANTRITVQQARAFVDAGFRFVVRYVRRSTKHDYDLTTGEFVGLLNAGLGVMIVQHVAAEGWSPTGDLGAAYGAIAAQEAAAVGYPRRCIVWCDLEGISALAQAADVIAFCNAWFDKVKEAGFDAGLYVGYGAGLTANQLYYKLKFRRYWAAYNLNRDSYPAVRGVCMQQGAYPSPAHRVPHIPFEYDVDEILADHFNNLPTLILPGDPG
jgi:hypothetical protein